MNELRMYVEHLFEGRVLTSDMIELKEEIYGNLVARYEDYLAGGMSEAEALQKTKASMTDIDDVLTGDAPTAPTPALARRRKVWPLVVGGIAAAFIVLAVAGALAFGALSSAGPATTIPPTSTTTGAGQAAAGASTAQSGATGSQGAASGGATAYIDPEDQAEYEATAALDSQISQMGIDVLKTAAASQDRAAFFAVLPLGDYIAQADCDSGAGSAARVEYANVPDTIDGDAVERALLYNAVAALCAYPDLATVTFSVHEQYDSVHEHDAFTFERAQLEHAFSVASDDAVTQLNSSLFSTADEWDRVRSYVFRENFRDRQLDIAERD